VRDVEGVGHREKRIVQEKSFAKELYVQKRPL
jgi:hypothetical protein